MLWMRLSKSTREQICEFRSPLHFNVILLQIPLDVDAFGNRALVDLCDARDLFLTTGARPAISEAWIAQASTRSAPHKLSNNSIHRVW